MERGKLKIKNPSRRGWRCRVGPDLPSTAGAGNRFSPPSIPDKSGRLASINRAFTLVEILMVIVIIGILIGLVISGITMIKGQTKVKQAQAMLEHLSAAETEYRAETGNVIKFNYLSFGTTDQNIDYPISNGEAASINLFIEYVKTIPNAYKNLKVVGSNKGQNWGFLYDSNYGGDPNTPNVVLDPWGNPIQYRSASNGDNPVWPGAASTTNLRPHGWYPTTSSDAKPLPKPFFASAGPDGKWGSYDKNTGKSGKYAKDNLYSFEVMK